MSNNKDDALNSNFSIKTKEDIEEEAYYKKLVEWYHLPMLKCPDCNFRNVYEVSMKQHRERTHRRNHANEVTSKMTEKDYKAWEQIFAGRAPAKVDD